MFDKEGREVLKPLTHAFCSSQITCFGGVLGAQTPYGDRPASEYTCRRDIVNCIIVAELTVAINFLTFIPLTNCLYHRQSNIKVKLCLSSR